MKLTVDLESVMAEEQRKRKIWKLVLTGGPCGGKTTGQARLSTFFENLGWKVYRVPETANVLLAGGVNFAELTPKAAENFQVLYPFFSYPVPALRSYEGVRKTPIVSFRSGHSYTVLVGYSQDANPEEPL